MAVSRWIVLLRFFAAPEFFDSYEAIGLIATAVTLYALYMVMVVILGRTGRTEFNLPAALAALVANVALNLILVPPLGIVGAGLALVASYLVVIALMYGFTQRLFPVPYEWGRLARVLLAAAALVGLGELVMPTSGFGGLVGRLALVAALPPRPPRQRLLHRRRARLAGAPAPPRRAGRELRRPPRPPRRGRRRTGRALRGRAHGRGLALLGGSSTVRRMRRAVPYWTMFSPSVPLRSPSSRSSPSSSSARNGCRRRAWPRSEHARVQIGHHRISGESEKPAKSETKTD